MWITETANKGRKLKDMYNVSGIDVYIKDRLPEDIDPDFIFNYISSRIPFHLARNLDVIYVGQFPEMAEREINAYFEDGALYVSNEQDDEMDIIDDIVHEIAHSVEKEYGRHIYTGRIEKEFEGKRRRLYDMLKAHGYSLSPVFKVKMEYDKEIDEFLYKEIGYEALGNLVNGLFPSPYSVTSLQEYYAIGFEEYFLGDVKYLKKVSPALYSVLESLMEDE